MPFKRWQVTRAATNDYFSNRLICRFLSFYQKHSLQRTLQIHSANNLRNVHKQAHYSEKVNNISVDLMLFSEISNLVEFCLKHF